MKERTVKIIEGDTDEWSVFTMGYLRLAELGLKELIEKKYNIENQGYEIEELYIPALFNFKHAIEIFLKLFSIKLLNKEFFDQSFYSHDTEELFLKLRKSVSEKTLNKAIKEHEKSYPNESDKLDVKEIFNDIEAIVKKYHTLSLLKDKIGLSFEIKDLDNTALKYPISNLNVKLKFSEILNKITPKDILESLSDSIRVQTLFWQLNYLISLEKIASKSTGKKESSLSEVVEALIKAGLIAKDKVAAARAAAGIQ